MLQEITKIIDIQKEQIPLNSSIKIGGWIKTRRDSKAGVSFIALSDGTAFHPLQIVVPNTLENYVTEVLNLTAGCSIIAQGNVVKSPGSGQSYELQATQIQVLGMVENPESYPITPKYHTVEYLREFAHLRSRTNIIGALTRVSNAASHAIHDFFYKRRFYWIRTPIITTSDCEGAGQMFRVSTLDLLNTPRRENGSIDFNQDFFGRETFLTVSGQLNVESYCEAMTRVYTFGPTFRAENSFTSRHLAEFWMIEPEIAFADLADDATLAEEMLKYLAETILKECPDDMAFFADKVDKDAILRLEKLTASNFVRMEYTEAVSILQKSKQKFTFEVAWGTDLQSEHERYLTEKHVGAPIILMNYPKEIKSFYMRLNEDAKTVAAMDILVPGIGEIIGGSQREERLDYLERRLTEMGLPKEPYAWYLDLRRYGTVPHAGFGLGFERFLAYATGISNVRDVIPFPRTTKHAEF